MENAAIIRTNCPQLMEQVRFAVKVIEEAMVEFKDLFKDWIPIFEKHKYEDDWGCVINYPLRYRSIALLNYSLLAGTIYSFNLPAGKSACNEGRRYR